MGAPDAVINRFGVGFDGLERNCTPIDTPASLLDWHFDLKGLVGVSIHGARSMVLPVDVGHAGLVLVGQGLGEGNLYHVLEFLQPKPVHGVLVVLRYSSMFLSTENRST